MLPQIVTDEFSALQAQVTAAGTLAKASRATVTALQLNAAQLVADVEAAEYSLAGALDTFTAPLDPVDIIQGVLGVFQNAADEANIAYLRALAGRVASNLDQLGPRPRPSLLQLPPGTPLPPVIGPYPVIMQPFAPTIAGTSVPASQYVATVFRSPPGRSMAVTPSTPTRTP